MITGVGCGPATADEAINMRYFCVVLALIGMPLSASAQQDQRSGQPPTGLSPIGLPLPAIGLPAPVNYPKPWEWTVAVPAWERRQVPAWERQAPPSWERGQVSQPIYRGPRHRQPYLGAAVVYVPYPVYEPYPVVVVAPAPEPPPPQVIEVHVVPPPPIVVPTGSRTLYVIPGCYLGNVPPDESRLREGCDVSKMKVHLPQ